MNTHEQQEIINEALAVRYADIESKVPSVRKQATDKLAAAMKMLFGLDVCYTCLGDIKNAYYKINSYIQNPRIMKQDKKQDKNRNFVMMPKAIIIHPETKQMYSDKNITDDVAKELLTKYPQLNSKFSKAEMQVVFEKKKEVEVTHEVAFDTNTNEVVSASEKDEQFNAAIEYVENARVRADLAAICEQNGYDRAEWKNKGLVQLKKYLIRKLNEVNDK